MPLDLVGADREPEPLGLEPVERLDDAGIKPRLDAEIFGVVGEEVAVELVEMRRGRFPADGLEAALDQRARARADQVARLLQRQGGSPSWPGSRSGS